jgi:ankyrin repeat protein
LLAFKITAVEVLRLLAQKKTLSISMRNNNGMTALHMAVLARNLPAIRVLLEEFKCSPDVSLKILIKKQQILVI